jgi:Ca-activated chloride channel family protein
MNSDDPKLTAYALDELDPAERAEVEQLLRENPAAALELEETAALAAQLRRELHAEAAAPLTEAQRAEVLTAVGTPVQGGNGASPAKIMPMRRRWSRVMALAASVAVLAGATFIALKSSQQPEPFTHSMSAAGTMANEVANPESLRSEHDSLVMADPSPAQMAPDASPLPEMAVAPQPISPKRPAEAAPVLQSDSMIRLAPSAQSLAQDAEASTAALTTSLASSSVTAGAKPTADRMPGATTAGRAGGAGLSFGVRAGQPALQLERGATSSAGVPARKAGSEDTARGIALYSQGKYDEAVAELTKALAANPSDATARNYLGITATQKGWQDTAVKELESAIATDPSYADAHFNLAVVLATQQPPKTAQGRLHYRRAIELGAERDEALEKLLGQREPSNTEAYDAITDNAFMAALGNPLSTFSIDVDTASYSNVRRFLNEQRLPPKGAVRIEELLNYFDYDYPQPDGEAPFSASMEVATCPWQPEHRLVRIGLKGRDIHPDKRPASNLVFLIDVSGSMQPENKLPLVKKSLHQLVDRLGAEDTVAIVVYAGAGGCVLEPTNKKSAMRRALEKLESGGSTNGAAGIQLAYQLAEKSFIKGGVNRVILATDGDFNVGVTNQSELVELIEKKAKGGVFLTVLGFGVDNLKDSTMEKLADKGNGNYAYIDTLLEGKKVLVEQMSGTLVTIAKDVKIQVEFNPAQVSSYRLIGYENRLLKKEDFNDDTKDAGEIGAGHTVTALYEIVPVGVKRPGPAVDPLKYQHPAVVEKSEFGDRKVKDSPEILTLKLRYKAPDGDTSKLLEFPLTDDGKSYERSSRDFRFAAAVASFGMLLRDSPHKGQANWNSTLELAIEGKGEDRAGYRAEFVGLIERAKAASR